VLLFKLVRYEAEVEIKNQLKTRSLRPAPGRITHTHMNFKDSLGLSSLADESHRHFHQYPKYKPAAKMEVRRLAVCLHNCPSA